MAAPTGSGLTRRRFLAGAAGVGLAAAAARSSVMGYTAPAGSPALVDASSFYGKLMFGYQGWFGTPGDGSAMDQWQHWCRGGTDPSASTIGVDVWPDLREFPAHQLVDSGLAYPDGSPAYLFSSYRPDIVAAHFEWMRACGIDGVFLQEFVSWLAPGSPQRQFRDGVTRNVLRAAGATGRAIAIMYCISPDDKPGAIVHQVESHWATVGQQEVSSSRYLHHKGRPLVALWGFGFIPGAGAGGGTQQEANQLLDFFEREGAAVMGGVPTYWRQGINDSEPGPAWAAVYRRFAVISPWTVGRYADPAGALQYAMTTLSDDIAEAGRVGADLVPVVFPGYSARQRTAERTADCAAAPAQRDPSSGRDVLVVADEGVQGRRGADGLRGHVRRSRRGDGDVQAGHHDRPAPGGAAPGPLGRRRLQPAVGLVPATGRGCHATPPQRGQLRAQPSAVAPGRRPLADDRPYSGHRLRVAYDGLSRPAG